MPAIPTPSTPTISRPNVAARLLDATRLATHAQTLFDLYLGNKNPQASSALVSGVALLDMETNARLCALAGAGGLLFFGSAEALRQAQELTAA